MGKSCRNYHRNSFMLRSYTWAVLVLLLVLFLQLKRWELGRIVVLVTTEVEQFPGSLFHCSSENKYARISKNVCSIVVSMILVVGELPNHFSRGHLGMHIEKKTSEWIMRMYFDSVCVREWSCRIEKWEEIKGKHARRSRATLHFGLRDKRKNRQGVMLLLYSLLSSLSGPSSGESHLLLFPTGFLCSTSSLLYFFMPCHKEYI